MRTFHRWRSIQVPNYPPGRDQLRGLWFRSFNRNRPVNFQCCASSIGFSSSFYETSSIRTRSLIEQVECWQPRRRSPARLTVPPTGLEISFNISRNLGGYLRRQVRLTLAFRNWKISPFLCWHPETRSPNLRFRRSVILEAHSFTNWPLSCHLLTASW